jgi:glutathione synthase/RimK-type ligase-like ATP-grasp enzyme
MISAWVVTRYLNDENANELDINNLIQEKQSSIFEALKVKTGLLKMNICAKIVSMTELGSSLYVSTIPIKNLPNIIIVRCMIYSYKEIEILNLYQTRGVMVINNPQSLVFCVFKHKQYEKLWESNIPIPITTSIFLDSSSDQIEDAMKIAKLKFPIVVKSNCGSRADSVFKCFTIDDIFESLYKIYKLYPYSRIAILQEWIDHRTKGILSVLTLGKEIIGIQQRIPKEETDFFISNHRQNSIRTEYKLDKELHDITLDALECMNNIEMSRLDIFHNGKHYLIGEVNSPGSFISYDLFMNMDCGLLTAKYTLEKYKKDNSC